MSENDTLPKDPWTFHEAMDILRERYGDQYDVRLVPSVRLGGGPHRCRCTIRVSHGEFSAAADLHYMEAFRDALKQTLEAAP
ncbi:hypothetical protein LCGC14_2101710 [marine sediment metagenome]|uniref:Uncharacterized protein n=1 Tax=marine sediment metagenome TaxID=412755 RepID=A0A0F9E9Y6_9ZZZZ